MSKEITSEWTLVNDKKKYECQNKKADGTHTMYFEWDRTKSDFSMMCDEYGQYVFVDLRENWPTCLEDILCNDIPPEIPSNPEYVNIKVNKL